MLYSLRPREELDNVKWQRIRGSTVSNRMLLASFAFFLCLSAFTIDGEPMLKLYSAEIAIMIVTLSFFGFLFRLWHRRRAKNRNSASDE